VLELVYLICRVSY